jgi:hypothetical protein
MVSVTISSNDSFFGELISRLNDLEKQARSLSLNECVDWSGIQAGPKGPTQSISNSHLGCQPRPVKILWSRVDCSKGPKPTIIASSQSGMIKR